MGIREMREVQDEGGRQITREEALAIHKCEAWKDWSDEQIVGFQLFQDMLAIPFGVFHGAIQRVLGRPVFTHEFADVPSLRAEYMKERAPKTFEEIVAMIPAEKLVIIQA